MFHVVAMVHTDVPHLAEVAASLAHVLLCSMAGLLVDVQDTHIVYCNQLAPFKAQQRILHLHTTSDHCTVSMLMSKRDASYIDR